MALRNGHGTGRGVPRIEVLPPNELPFAETDGSVPLVAGRDRLGRIRTAEAARAMGKLPRRGNVLPRKIACHPRFDVHNRRRLEWLRARRAEIASMTGGVSHGVGAMLASAAWLYAGAEFCAELGAEKGDAEMLKTTASLSSTARQHDLAAWELAVREGKARSATQDAEALPWLEAPEPKGAA